MSSEEPVKTVRATILLVDDDPFSLKILSGLLHSHYDILAAPSGERALNIATGEQKPDLVLLDIVMPDMDGYEVLARLRENPSTRDIPVIFTTGLDSAEDKAKSLKLGAADFINKPYHAPTVLASVHAQLELRRAQERPAAAGDIDAQTDSPL